jgi:ATP-dependent helicase Lhr and Lhr-like helicase
MVSAGSILGSFHPLVARWFADRFGEPTDAQARAWPRIAAGEHVLVTAPTGSGKTLTAFLWALDRLAGGHWPTGRTSVLYISPLKALNNDIQRNLLVPLGELREVFHKAGEAFPDIRVLTRSGDTPQSDRRRMKRRPPEILITTPESLNLLLSSHGGRSILTDLSTVILDEIHAVVDSKRGTHLISAVERLVRLSGEFQRVALSATVRPLEGVAAFVGGFRAEGDPARPTYVARPVAIVRSDASKEYDVRVRFHPDAAVADPGAEIWEPLAREFRSLVERNRSTLLFANSRRLCEKLTQLINASADRTMAYAHHGSLSREIRHEVERKLKAGELRSIVATNSLEMGIDIGSLDEVVLIQSPPSISSAIQRVGRAGHHVGEVSRAELYPSHGRDLLDAAVLARGIVQQDIEEIRPIRGPLDVLAQTLVSMTGTAVWDIDELFGAVRTAYPYHELSRAQFDLVLNLLAGRYGAGRLRELKPRVSIDRTDNTVAARPGALHAIYSSGGTIPDRGYFRLRHDGSGARIGELDEEFVWEASIGQGFVLGTQRWRIQRITHNDVFVVPGSGGATAPPFWRGEQAGRDWHFSRRIGEFLEDACERLDSPELVPALIRDHCMEPPAAEHLVAFLKRQRASTGAIPHRHRVVVEIVATAPGGAPGTQAVLHTLWGARVNRPLALALDAAWEQRHGHRLEMYVADDCIALLMPDEVSAEELLSLVSGANVETLLRKRLEGSGFFGARFRECAGRALLVTRGGIGKRMPLWVTRLRSQKLLDSVLRYADFPILLEAWRTCLQDEFDMEALQGALAELASGATEWVEARTDTPSPFAGAISWDQVNTFMYMTDALPGGKASSLRGDLLREVVFAPHLRPAVAREVVRRFERKRQRLSEGYSPGTPRDLLDWVQERLAIPWPQWEALLEAMRRDHGPEAEGAVAELGGRLVRAEPTGAREPLVAATEMLPRLRAGLWSGQEIAFESFGPTGEAPIGDVSPVEEEDPLRALLGEWLSFFGPRRAESLSGTLGIEPQRVREALDDLIDAEQIIEGELVAGDELPRVCDAENFEILLRMSRAAAAPSFEALEIRWLAPFLAEWQGVEGAGEGSDDLADRLESLLCLPVSARLWESEILPARLGAYSTAWMDALMQATDLRWIGSGREKIALCFESDLDMLGRDARSEPTDDEESPAAAPDPRELFPDARGRYDFATLMQRTGLTGRALSDRLWDAAWDGRVTNDTFLALRRGLANRFRVPDAAPASDNSRRRHGGRGGFRRWKGAAPLTGNWYVLPEAIKEDDLLEAEERRKDRARLLLDRYGVLFRELLQREAPAFRWGEVFRALRLMELSGEVLSGVFFEDVPGPQFASRKALRALRSVKESERIWWICAADPASVCGLGLEALRAGLPRRLAGTHLVYRGAELMVISRRSGGALTILVAPDDPRLPEYLRFLEVALSRPFEPVRRIAIETINDSPAAQSEYLPALREQFDANVDYKNVILYRRLL